MALNKTIGICGFVFLTLIQQSVSAQQQVQHWLAAQHDWGASRGFFVSVQNVSNNGVPAKLADCKIQFGVGDGKQWHFAEGSANWAIGTKYDVTATIKDGSATLVINDKAVDSKPVAFSPTTGNLSAGYQPSFLIGPADYRVVQSSVQVVSDADQLEKTFASPKDDAGTAALRRLNPTMGSYSRAFNAGKTVTIKASFAFVASGAVPEDKSPLVDQYGQAIAAKWPGKITQDQQLVDQIATEQAQLKQWPAPTGLDQFGGSTRATWKSAATGFYRVEKKNNFWWLITPEGHPCFYLGVCDAPSLAWEGTPVTGREELFAGLPPREGKFAAAWRKNIWSFESPDSEYFIPHAANLIRKYGDDWQPLATASTVARLRAMGFNGLGKWSQDVPTMPIAPVLQLGSVDKLTSHPDPWNPAVQQQVRAWLEKEVGPRKSDPWIVGWSIQNEKEAFPTIDDVKKILSSDETTPARIALTDFAKKQNLDLANPQTLESLRVQYADALFDLYYRTIKEIDPNHLYFGNWVTPNWWINENDWNVTVKHCDVIGFDRYAMLLSDEPMKRLMDAQDKPMLCGEFSFPPDYSGARGQGTYPIAVRTEEESAERYKQWIADSAVHPKVIGALYFQYRDQPLLGRGPGGGPNSPVIGENFAFGLIDITDRLKIPFCTGVRDANLKALETRLKSTDPAR